MSKLSRKEAKEKVLRTKIGKKTKKNMIIVAIIFFITCVLNLLLMDMCNEENYSITLTIAIPIINIIFIISGFLTFYFDGKMDGLIASHTK